MIELLILTLCFLVWCMIGFYVGYSRWLRTLEQCSLVNLLDYKRIIDLTIDKKLAEQEKEGEE